MKLIPIILIILTSCAINFNGTPKIYTSEFDVDTKLIIFTENGTITFDTVNLMFDDYIPRYDASPVFVNFQNYRNYFPIIVNEFGEPILFDSDESLIYYMANRGYDFDGLRTIKKRNYQSVWVFIKK